MSFLKQANIGYNKDEFWSGQAIVETKYSVGDMTAARTSKVNAKKKFIGNKTATAANTGMQVNYLCVFFKSATSAAGKTPPVVFDSLTGMGFDENKDTKFTVMERLTLAGRLQSSINYEGTIPHQRDVSVQCGGMCAIRLFMKDPQENVSWMDRLCWTIPDIDDTTKAEQQYRHLQGLARQEFPVGKIPILVEKMSALMYAEFPRVALKMFCKKSLESLAYHRSEALASSADPLEVYIRSNFVFPVRMMLGLFEFVGEPDGSDDGRQWGTDVQYPEHLKLGGTTPLFSTEPRVQDRDRLIVFTIIYLNVGLLTWPFAKATLLKLQTVETLNAATGNATMDIAQSFIARMDGDSKVMKYAQNVASNAMQGQYQCFTYLRDHNFGKALTVGRPGDGVRVLFRI